MTPSINFDKVVQLAAKKKVTLLGIGPMSRNTVRASIEISKELNFPLVFIASRNQIDSDEFGSGYVNNWNQDRFVSDVRQISEESGHNGFIYICRDHGGQLQSNFERIHARNYGDATNSCYNSYLADVNANFDLIHVDPTKEYCKKESSLTDVIDRVVNSISYIESVKKNNQLIDYEVGTEENSGRIISEDNFIFFVIRLLERLERRNLPKPTFIVGQIGTLVKMAKNVGSFNYQNTLILLEICKKYSIHFKAHNCDYLSIQDLSLFPKIGISGANVAPEFGVAETKSYLKLSSILSDSTFIEAIYQLLLVDSKWIKWLEDSHTIENVHEVLSDVDKRLLIIEATAHYYFSEPTVVSAISNLIASAKFAGIDTPERLIIDNIKSAIRKYIYAFNLVEFNTEIRLNLTTNL
jgi:hypothetical protein